MTLAVLLPLPMVARAQAQPIGLSARTEFLANQCADNLDVRAEFQRLKVVEKDSKAADQTREILLRKALGGYLDVRRGVNKTEAELNWAYGVLAREQSKQNAVNQFLNTANFAHFSVLYTLEPYARLHGHFRESAVLTCVGAGVGTAIPVMGIIYNKFHRAGHTAPPPQLAPSIEGGPVDANELPATVQRFLDSNDINSTSTRRDEMFAVWRQRYHVDPAKIGTLCSLRDGHSKSFNTLNTRILLLWSLHTYIEKFDEELAALIDVVQDSGGTGETRELLAILAGMLDVRQAADKIDADLNYAYDVVLANLVMRRQRGLQRNFDLHFIETGVFGAIAGGLYIKNKPKAGNEMFVISSAIGLGLSTFALWQLRGGTRKLDTPPNSLAIFFADKEALVPNFPTQIETYIQSHRDLILASWKKKKTSTMDLSNLKNRRALAGSDPAQPDTIEIVRNRIALLHSLKSQLQAFDSELFARVKALKPVSFPGCVIASTLDVRTTLDRIDSEVTNETEVLDRLLRMRDLAVTMTNNANFFQINILGIIADGPLGLSAQTSNKRAANHLNIVSGIMTGALAGAALLEQPGGFSLHKAKPNTLGAALGLPDSCGVQLSPELTSFIAAKRASLIKYWKASKVVHADVTKGAVLQKLAACGPKHHIYDERIKLINDRIRMLYDVKAIIGLRVAGLANSLEANKEME